MFKKALVVVAAVLALVALLGAAAPAAAQGKVKKSRTSSGVAGQISPFRIPAQDLSTLAIAGPMSEGAYCAVHKGTHIHAIGYLPAATKVHIDFESGETSDPVAALLAIRFTDQGAQVEAATSDDEGGNLNPVFEVTKDYEAIWLLVVASADGEPACYTYKVTAGGQ